MLKLFKLFSLLLLITISQTAWAGELKRAALLGVVPNDTTPNSAVTLQRLLPNSTASHLGLKVGDTLLQINGKAVSDFSGLLGLIKQLKVGDSLTVELLRNERKIQLTGKMQPRPYETSQHAEVLYESVEYPNNALRSITYKPKGLSEGKQEPAIFFIQGYTCSSIDYGMLPDVTTKQMIEQFAEAGYVVFRVEKPGVGDSQSTKHCSEIDFTAESLGFTHALKQLKTKSYVNPQQVYLWGHSLGVLHSVVMAEAESVAGIIGYGGVLKPWCDYMLDIYRHQSTKHFGTSQNRAERNTQIMQPFLDLWLNQDTPWQQVSNSSQAKAAIDAQLVQINGEQVIDRHYSFFRDLSRYRLKHKWQQIKVPLLMMHGSLDIQAIDKQWAFDLVGLSSNPLSEALQIEGAEHGFMRYESHAAYMRARNSGSYNPARPEQHFDARIGEHTLAWLDKITAANQGIQYSGINRIEYHGEFATKPFIGNGFLIAYKGKTYGVTVKHTLLEAKTPEMDVVDIDSHIKRWTIHPNGLPDQGIVLGALLNSSSREKIDMQVLQKDWLVFEVKQNQSNLEVLKIRRTPLKAGEVLTAYGCSYQVKEDCVQDVHRGVFLKQQTANLRVKMKDLNLAGLRGLSGSPVLDENHQLVGIVSNVLKSESGEGFDFAPASLDYLLSVLSVLEEG